MPQTIKDSLVWTVSKKEIKTTNHLQLFYSSNSCATNIKVALHTKCCKNKNVVSQDIISHIATTY